MTVLEVATSDIYILLAILLRVLASEYFGNPLKDGYHIVQKKGFRYWEETYILSICILEVYLLTWVATAFIQSGNEIVPYLGVDMWTVVLGILLALRFGPAWFRTLRDTNNDRPLGIVRSSGLLVSVLFGIGLSVSLVIATHPDVDTLHLLYRYHLNLSFNVMRQFQAILGLSIPHMPWAAVDHTLGIFKNNVTLAAKAGGLGFAGGLAAGLGIPLVLIMAVNAGVLFGAFTGILIRNSVSIAGTPFEVILAPPVAFLSSMGLLIAGHTFHEFMAIIVAGVGMGFVGMGLVKGIHRSVTGAKLAIAGGLQLAIAAFFEVFVSSTVVNHLLGYITVQSRIVPVEEYYLLGLVSTIATTGVMIVIIAWMIRTTFRYLEMIA